MILSFCSSAKAQHDFVVFNVHLPSGGPIDRFEAAVAGLYKSLDELPDDRPWYVMGDFVKAFPRVWRDGLILLIAVVPEARGGLGIARGYLPVRHGAHLAEWGLNDMYKRLHPGGRAHGNYDIHEIAG